MGNKRIKIAVAVEQFVSVNDAARGDQRVDGFADGDAHCAQPPIIARGFDGDRFTADRDDRHRTHPLEHAGKLMLGIDALQYFRQNQIANGKRILTDQLIEKNDLRRLISAKRVNPDA